MEIILDLCITRAEKIKSEFQFKLTESGKQKWECEIKKGTK